MHGRMNGGSKLKTVTNNGLLASTRVLKGEWQVQQTVQLVTSRTMKSARTSANARQRHSLHGKEGWLLLLQ
jgi:hypothetical protein